MIKILLCFFLISIGITVHSQTDDTVKFIYPYTGITIQRQLYGELGITYGDKETDMGPCADRLYIILPKIGAGFSIYHHSLITAPMASAEITIAGIGARINLIDYTDFHANDYRFTPEIGISFNRIMEIFYGYNIPISNERAGYVSTNQLSIIFNLPI